MRVLFLFVGEHHHVFHGLPVAAELAALRPDYEVEVAVAGQEHLRCVEGVRQAYPGFTPTIHPLPVPWPLRPLASVGLGRFVRLLTATGWLPGFDAIVVPERTSTVLRHVLTERTSLVFTPHGAGDRAIMLDPRDRHFDFVLVAGHKSERRLLAAGNIRKGHYAVNGYVKLDLMGRLRQGRAPLFDNGRPTVLYAPHFRHALSSWPRHGKAVIEAFRQQDRYNLVFAPHIRLFRYATRRHKRQIQSLAEPGKILIDLDSERLVDMTYTGGADVYLGDVSSQVYEFLAEPRPCVFLNSHGVTWQQNPDYRFWHLGEVIDDPSQVLAAVDRSFAAHEKYVDEQRAALADSVGGDPAGAAQRGAIAISEFLESRSRTPGVTG